MKLEFKEKMGVKGVILIDLPLSKETMNFLRTLLLSESNWILREIEELADWIRKIIENLKDESNTLILLPGEGAKIAFKALNLSYPTPSHLIIPFFAKRYWIPGSQPIVMVHSLPLEGEILSEGVCNVSSRRKKEKFNC